MSRFKVVPRRPGITFATTYRATIEGALDVARSTGFPSPGDPVWENKPRSVEIYENVGERQFELVATLTPEALIVVPAGMRPSFRAAQERIAGYEAQMLGARMVAEKLSAAVAAKA